jgi:RNA polymerase sigma factor (sigma-70 family)
VVTVVVDGGTPTVDALSTRFEALYLEHYEEAVRWGAAITGDLDSGRDAAHDAFVRIFSRLRPLRSEQAFPFYLRRTVVNAALARLRSERRDAARAERFQHHAPADPADAQRLVLREALAALPPKQRAIVVLRYVLDMSEVETARLMACRVGTVKSASARGLAALEERTTPGE